MDNTIKLKDYPAIIRQAIATSQPDSVFIEVPEINGLLVNACFPNSVMRLPQHYYQLFINETHIFDIYSWLLEHGAEQDLNRDLMCALVEANLPALDKVFGEFTTAMDQFKAHAENDPSAAEGTDVHPVLLATTAFMITRVSELNMYMGRISAEEGIVYRSGSTNLDELINQMKSLGRRELHALVIAGKIDLDLTQIGKNNHVKSQLFNRIHTCNQ